jgi:hypothetical protein
MLIVLYDAVDDVLIRALGERMIVKVSVVGKTVTEVYHTSVLSSRPMPSARKAGINLQALNSCGF